MLGTNQSSSPILPRKPQGRAGVRGVEARVWVSGKGGPTPCPLWAKAWKGTRARGGSWKRDPGSHPEPGSGEVMGSADRSDCSGSRVRGGTCRGSQGHLPPSRPLGQQKDCWASGGLEGGSDPCGQRPETTPSSLRMPAWIVNDRKDLPMPVPPTPQHLGYIQSPSPSQGKEGALNCQTCMSSKRGLKIDIKLSFRKKGCISFTPAVDGDGCLLRYVTDANSLEGVSDSYLGGC